jgi:hypothetical protein
VLLLSSRYVKLYFFRPFSKSVTGYLCVSGTGRRSRSLTICKALFFSPFFKALLMCQVRAGGAGKAILTICKALFFSPFFRALLLSPRYRQ